MKKNWNCNDNTRFFSDTTYDCIPPQRRGMKLFVILSYNKKLNIILLCILALIYNKNKETLEKLFTYLKLNFSFNPKLYTIYLGKAGYIAIKKYSLKLAFFHVISILLEDEFYTYKI